MMPLRPRGCLALIALAASVPARADDWSSIGGAVVLAWVLLSVLALQLLVSAALAVRRGRHRGWKSGLRYFGAALLMVPATLVLLWLATSMGAGLSTGHQALDLALFSGLPPVAVWGAFLLMVRENDQLPENDVTTADASQRRTTPP
jgi:hypothetical protein